MFLNLDLGPDHFRRGAELIIPATPATPIMLAIEPFANRKVFVYNGGIRIDIDLRGR
jgi:hypothetical protein